CRLRASSTIAVALVVAAPADIGKSSFAVGSNLVSRFANAGVAAASRAGCPGGKETAGGGTHGGATAPGGGGAKGCALSGQAAGRVAPGTGSEYGLLETLPSALGSGCAIGGNSSSSSSS